MMSYFILSIRYSYLQNWNWLSPSSRSTVVTARVVVPHQSQALLCLVLTLRNRVRHVCEQNTVVRSSIVLWIAFFVLFTLWHQPQEEYSALVISIENNLSFRKNGLIMWLLHRLKVESYSTNFIKKEQQFMT